VKAITKVGNSHGVIFDRVVTKAIRRVMKDYARTMKKLA
jgi:hypothetical protein